MKCRPPGQEPRIAVIGAGAMARALVADGTSAFHDADALGRRQPDPIVECAEHGTVRHALSGFLARGTDVAIGSVGASMDRSLQQEGAVGRLSFQVANRSLPDNPRTSLLADVSVQRAVLDHFSPIDFPMTNRPTP